MRGIFYYACLDPDDCVPLFEQNDRTMRQLTLASKTLDTTLRRTWTQGQSLEFKLQHDSKHQRIELLIEDPAVSSRFVRASRRSSAPARAEPDLWRTADRPGKPGGQRRGWATGTFDLYGRPTEKKYKTFVVTWRTAGGAIRVVLVDEPKGWVAFFRTDTAASVADILASVAERFSLEIAFRDVKEIVGAGQQQVRYVRASVGAFHVCLWGRSSCPPAKPQQTPICGGWPGR